MMFSLFLGLSNLIYIGFIAANIVYKVLNLNDVFCRLCWPHQACEWAGSQ